MPSNVARGNYFKLRTKRWLEGQGYAVAFMERMHFIPATVPGGRPIGVKKDQFGSDLLAMSTTALVFVQVKYGATPPSLRKAREEFLKHPFPPGPIVRRWVVVWAPRAKAPTIVECFGVEDNYAVEERHGTH